MIIESLANFVIWVISHLGYLGVYFLMLLEACCIPIPSEVILPFAGFSVATGQFNFWLVVLLGALGDLSGSLLAYYIGYKGGRPLVEKYGKYIFLSHRDLDKADHFFNKYGEATAFFSRMMPVVRTFISLPAGISKMNIKKFVPYTFFGVLPFSFILTYAGMKLGENWELVRQTLRRFDLAIVIILVLLIAWWIGRHLRGNKPAEES